MRRWQVRQTCNMVEPPAYSRSGQTWAEVCRACLPPFPDCSHSPPCRTHDSAPVLSYHKIDSQINYTGEESLPPPPPPQVWELPLREGQTWVQQSSAPFQGSHRSPGGRICQNWKKRQFQFTNITTTVLFVFWYWTPQINAQSLQSLSVSGGPIKYLFGKHWISWNATIFSRKR